MTEANNGPRVLNLADFRRSPGSTQAELTESLIKSAVASPDPVQTALEILLKFSMFLRRLGADPDELGSKIAAAARNMPVYTPEGDEFDEYVKIALAKSRLAPPGGAA